MRSKCCHVRVTGWREGLNKIAMTKAIRSQAGVMLGVAKSCTDLVLDGVPMTIALTDEHAARALAAELQELGAFAEFVPKEVMPYRIRITRGRLDDRRVNMALALRNAGIRLAAAKDCMESVLLGEAVTVTVGDRQTAQTLVDELTSCGATAEMASMDNSSQVTHRPLGRTGFLVSPIAFGAFKIGRNEKIKYPSAYDLPDEAATARLLNAVLDAGINLLDTAPAYGLSEERIGRSVAARRLDYVLSTKVGEVFENGESRYEFTADSIRTSVARSRERVRSDVLDLLFLHVNADDVAILRDTEAVATLRELKAIGKVRAIGLSSKTPEAARRALDWADALMVEYHIDDRSHEAVIAEAASRGVGVIVKKGLASGRLPADEAIRFVLSNPGVTSLTVGSLNLAHLQHNLATALAAIPQ